MGVAPVDYWDAQEGRIYDCLTIPMLSAGAIYEGSAVEFGTAAANTITIQACNGNGDGWGVALKYASAAGETIPVLLIGVYKCTRDGTEDITAGMFVYNSVAGAGLSGATASPNPVIKPAGVADVHNFAVFGGTSYILGMALQSSASYFDEILVFVGKTF